MEVMSVGLGLAPDHLREVFGERPLSFAKLISYPPTPPGEAGVNAHHDAGFLTLLMQHEVGGLQVAEPRRRLDRRAAPRRRVRRQPRRDAAADDRQLLRRHHAPGHRRRGPLLVRATSTGPTCARRSSRCRSAPSSPLPSPPARATPAPGSWPSATSCSPGRAARRRHRADVVRPAAVELLPAQLPGERPRPLPRSRRVALGGRRVKVVIHARRTDVRIGSSPRRGARRGRHQARGGRLASASCCSTSSTTPAASRCSRAAARCTARSRMPPGMSITTAGGIADLVDARRPAARDGPHVRRRTLGVHRQPPRRARPSSSASTDPCSTRPSWCTSRRSPGARIVQRTAVFGQVRLFADRRVISWDGQSWTDRPTAAALLTALRQARPGPRPRRRPRDARPRRALAVAGARRGHDRRPRAGLRVVVDGRGHEVPRAEAVDHEPPALPGAVRVAAAARPGHARDGRRQRRCTSASACAPASRPSAAVDSDRGMRHRSAQRFSYDHPSTTIAVISDNGPVTIFRHGRADRPRRGQLSPSTKRRTTAAKSSATSTNGTCPTFVHTCRPQRGMACSVAMWLRSGT